MGYWMDNAMENRKHTLVDMGYANLQEVRDATDRLTKVVAKRNVEIVYIGRVLVRIPPSKVKNVLAVFPEIKEGETYSWCTHHFTYDNHPPKSLGETRATIANKRKPKRAKRGGKRTASAVR